MCSICSRARLAVETTQGASYLVCPACDRASCESCACSLEGTAVACACGELAEAHRPRMVE